MKDRGYTPQKSHKKSPSGGASPVLLVHEHPLMPWTEYTAYLALVVPLLTCWTESKGIAAYELVFHSFSYLAVIRQQLLVCWHYLTQYRDG